LLGSHEEWEFLIQNDLEKRVTKAVNMSKIGSLGVGGTTTVLATFIKVGPQRASGVRILSFRRGAVLIHVALVYCFEIINSLI